MKTTYLFLSCNIWDKVTIWFLLWYWRNFKVHQEAGINTIGILCLCTQSQHISFWLGWNHTGTPNPFTSHKLLHINALILTYVFLFLPTFEFVEVVVTWLNWHIMSNFPIFGGNTINKLGQILFLCSVGRDKKRQFLLRHKLKWQ